MIKNVGFTEPMQGKTGWRNEMIASWRNYMMITLGLSEKEAIERALSEIEGADTEIFLENFEKRNILLENKVILDLGSGHGTLAIALAKRNANVTGVEPCEPWRRIAQKRAESENLMINFINADGANMPFADSSFDLVVSLQVLEHVASPRKVIDEIARVLKPNGICLLSCENYLTFYEPHYRIRWLPLLPKSIGKLYLQIQKRDPRFLMENISYTIYPKLIWDCMSAGLWSLQWPVAIKKLPKRLRFLRLMVLHRWDIFNHGFFHFFVKQG